MRQNRHARRSQIGLRIEIEGYCLVIFPKFHFTATLHEQPDLHLPVVAGVLNIRTSTWPPSDTTYFTAPISVDAAAGSIACTSTPMPPASGVQQVRRQ